MPAGTAHVFAAIVVVVFLIVALRQEGAWGLGRDGALGQRSLVARGPQHVTSLHPPWTGEWVAGSPGLWRAVVSTPSPEGMQASVLDAGLGLLGQGVPAS